jgi:hypothetical protein
VLRGESLQAQALLEQAAAARARTTFEEEVA